MAYFINCPIRIKDEDLYEVFRIENKRQKGKNKGQTIRKKNGLKSKEREINDQK